MFVFRRRVNFADSDAARIVFFARFLDYCHEALEALFDALGGYPHMTTVRDIGIPTARIEVDYHAPLRYGDVARFEVDVLRLGRTSATFRHRIRRDADGLLAATVRHVIVFVKLSTLTPAPIADDVRALLASHVADDAEVGVESRS